jgi:hypothetical protein
MDLFFPVPCTLNPEPFIFYLLFHLPTRLSFFYNSQSLLFPHATSILNKTTLDYSINNGIINMRTIHKLLKELLQNQTNVRYLDLCKICDHCFGKPRQSGYSHRIYKIPWHGDPRVNIQNNKGMAKAYQVRQVLKAIERLEAEDGS